MRFPKVARDLLSILGSTVLFLLFVAFSQRVAEVGWVRVLISAIPCVALYIALSAKKPRSPRFPVPLAVPKGFLLLSPCLFILINFAGRPVANIPGFDLFFHAVVFCLLVGLGEELMFRGVFFVILDEWRLPMCLLISSLIFGLCHFHHGIVHMGTTFVAGLAFGLARIAGMPLSLLVLIHAIVDLPSQLPHQPADFYPIAGFAGCAFAFGVSIWYLAIPRHWLEQFAAAGK